MKRQNGRDEVSCWSGVAWCGLASCGGAAAVGLREARSSLVDVEERHVEQELHIPPIQ